MSEEVSKKESKNTPNTFVIGNCKLTEFENAIEGKDYTMKSIKVSKFYKDDKAESGWSENATFSFNELQKLQILLTEYVRLMSPMKVR